MTNIRHQATSAYTYISPHGTAVAGQVISRTTSAAALAALGYEWADPPVPVVPVPTLAQLKSAAIEANRAECRRRIVEVWPEDQQRNAALGILSTELTDACAAWIKACRAAENAAADLIDAATDAAGVAAVKVVRP